MPKSSEAGEPGEGGQEPVREALGPGRPGAPCPCASAASIARHLESLGQGCGQAKEVIWGLQGRAGVAGCVARVPAGAGSIRAIRGAGQGAEWWQCGTFSIPSMIKDPAAPTGNLAL